MREALILPGDTVWAVAARTIGASSYGVGAYGAYVAAIVALNPQQTDWTALVPGQTLRLPN